MNLNIDITNVICLDVETVPLKQNWQELTEKEQQFFDLKTQYQRDDETTAEEFYNKAGIWAEFGKIICISVAYFVNNKDGFQLRVNSFYGDDEAKILTDFASILNIYFAKPQYLLCAHNGKEFDFPFIARRMLIQGIKLPAKLNLFGKKPWEIPHLDTMELWKFGDYKHFTSLNLLAHILDIPSPKDDIDGSKVAEVYYKEKNLKRIVEYCEKDTITVAQILLRLQGLEILKITDIVSVS